MEKNSKVENLMENKDFVLEILKKPNAEEVKKAFAGRGVNLDQKDVDSLGAALNNILSIVSKYSPKEIDKMANMFETMDSASLVKVAGGFTWKDAMNWFKPSESSVTKMSNVFSNGVSAVVTSLVPQTPEQAITFHCALKKAGGYDKDGNLTDLGKNVLNACKLDMDALLEMVKQAVQRQSPSVQPAPIHNIAGSSTGGGNNNNFYLGIGATAVSACALVYMFKNEIKSLFK